MKNIAADPLIKQQVRAAVLLARFKTESPHKKSAAYCRIIDISKALSVPYSSVQHICRSALKRISPAKRDTESRRLEQQHLEFLLSQETLRLWAGFTLKQRCKLFHRYFINKKIAVTSLRRLYLKHGIKRKAVRQEKVKPQHVLNEFAGRCKQVLN